MENSCEKKSFFHSSSNLFCFTAEEYGGCEGVDSMYVRLVSSDGHEFVVKRDYALTSGTIKSMLSGPGQFAENETNEVTFREIPYVNFKLY